MITADITDTSFGRDISSLITAFVTIICIGVAAKTIQILIGVSDGSVTVEKAKLRIHRLFMVLVITITLQELSSTIVNGYFLNGVDANGSNINVVAQKAILFVRDLMRAAMVLGSSLTIVMWILKLIELQHASEEDRQGIKKQAARILIIGAAINSVFAIVQTICAYFGQTVF